MSKAVTSVPVSQLHFFPSWFETWWKLENGGANIAVSRRQTVLKTHEYTHLQNKNWWQVVWWHKNQTTQWIKQGVLMLILVL